MVFYVNETSCQEGWSYHFLMNNGILHHEGYTKSPMFPVLDQGQIMRVRFHELEDDFAYPIFKELKEEGVTDYLSLPMLFQSGLYNNILWDTTKEGAGMNKKLSFYIP